MRSVIEMPRNPRRIFADDRGSIGIIFGVALLPLIFFSGAAIDYGRAMQAKTLLQASADAAVVAASYHKGDTAAKMQAAANVFAANATPVGTSGVTP